MLNATHKITGGILWGNLHLLFWLSLIPFATNWMGESHFTPIPTAIYGFVLLMAAIAYLILQWQIICIDRHQSFLKLAIGSDPKGKLSPLLYLIAILFAFWYPKISQLFYVFVALIWLVPDRRIENAIQKKSTNNQI
jgi:uncharacterized membrane protein